MAVADFPRSKVCKEDGVALEKDIPVLNGKVLEDFTVLEKRLRKPKLLSNALDKLRQTAPGLFARLRAGIASGDGKAISDAAHALGSSSTALGAMRVHALCKQLDVLGAQRRLDGIPELLTLLEKEYAVAIDALDQFIQQKPS